MSNPELDKMCTPFEVFEAAWREDGGTWGFWHVDHWAFYRTEAEARAAAAYLCGIRSKLPGLGDPVHTKFEVSGTCTYEGGFVVTVEAETREAAEIIARTLVRQNDPAVGHAQLDMTEVSIEDVTETA